MKNNPIDWTQLLETNEFDERSMITDEEMLKESERFVQSVRSHIQQETTVLAVRGKIKSDLFWATQEVAQEEGSDEEQCYMGTRVRLQNGSLTLEWYRNTFRTSITPKGNQKKVYSKYIRKDEPNGYSDAIYKTQPGWAKDLIREVETEYQRIRKRTELLGKIKRALRDYEALMKTDSKLR